MKYIIQKNNIYSLIIVIIIINTKNNNKKYYQKERAENYLKNDVHCTQIIRLFIKSNVHWGRKQHI